MARRSPGFSSRQRRYVFSVSSGRFWKLYSVAKFCRRLARSGRLCILTHELKLFERVVVFLSAAPIGVLMNLLRINATVFVYCTLGPAAAHAFFHDLAGWLMMPLAFAALWIELALLARLFIAVPQTAGPVPLTLPRQSPSRPATSTIPHNAPTSALTV